ncbi:alpha/beta hydrolase [Salimicrobium jeotgali]|uniref:alpha/beta hydrolase n=1 Tax=Salimicrobium jeotgali TaxID=1230341 RepID=UPI00147185F1|nr:alpha/beta hydrolase [Salimicrobium jeotgali]MBM7696750.1 pimeloyl-ACP methyl ester carboxylesterase [Salimicrobium jeotgali]
MRLMYRVLFSVVVLLSLAACQGDDPDSQSPEKEDENSSETSEESNIEGELWKGDGDLAVVLSHGAVYNAESWDDQGKKLADNGITAFATKDTSPRTLKKAAAMLKEEHGAEEVAVMGASAGGSSAIEAVTEGDFDFQKVVLLSPGGDPMEISDTPVLTVYSEDEGYRELEESTEEVMKTMEISGGAHAQEIFKGEKSEEVMSEIIRFLKDENTS